MNARREAKELPDGSRWMEHFGKRLVSRYACKRSQKQDLYFRVRCRMVKYFALFLATEMDKSVKKVFTESLVTVGKPSKTPNSSGSALLEGVAGASKKKSGERKVLRPSQTHIEIQAKKELLQAKGTKEKEKEDSQVSELERRRAERKARREKEKLKREKEKEEAKEKEKEKQKAKKQLVPALKSPKSPKKNARVQYFPSTFPPFVSKQKQNPKTPNKKR